MTSSVVRPFVRALACGAMAFSLLSAGAGMAAAETPFTNLKGNWSGPGVITMGTGARENIRCRATYNVDGSGNNLTIALRCASESYNFNLTSSVTNTNGAVTGIWNESTNSVGGTINGRGSPGRIQVRAEGMIITAMLSVNTQANRQSISISSPGSPIADVSITMNRAK